MACLGEYQPSAPGSKTRKRLAEGVAQTTGPGGRRPAARRQRFPDRCRGTLSRGGHRRTRGSPGRRLDYDKVYYTYLLWLTRNSRSEPTIRRAEKEPPGGLPGDPRARRQGGLPRRGRVLLRADLEPPHADRLRPPGEPVPHLVRERGAGAAPGHARPGRPVSRRAPRRRAHPEPGPRGTAPLLRYPGGPPRGGAQSLSVGPGGAPPVRGGPDARGDVSTRRVSSSPPSRRTVCTGFGTGRSWGRSSTPAPGSGPSAGSGCRTCATTATTGRCSLRKKEGKAREIPVRHDLDEWIAAYLEGGRA